MTTTELLLQLKYRFRDYFIPVEGKSGSLVGLEDYIEEYIESNYPMKIEFKINRQKIIALNGVLSGYDQVDFNTLNKPAKRTYSLRIELRQIFIKKTLSSPEKKEFKMKLPYYLAEELLDVLFEYCISSQSYLTGLDQLKNDLHQKLL